MPRANTCRFLRGPVALLLVLLLWLLVWGSCESLKEAPGLTIGGRCRPGVARRSDYARRVSVSMMESVAMIGTPSNSCGSVAY